MSPNPKKAKPFHRVPVATRTAALKEWYSLPSDSKPSSRTRTTMSFPWKRRTKSVPGRGSRGSVVQRLLQKVLRRADAEVGVVGNFERATAGAFGEAALDIRLDAPGDAPE